MNSTISTKVYCYLNDIVDFPECVICGKKIDDLNANITSGFRKTCSKECSNKYRHQKTVEACLAKYGVENVYALKTTIKKTADTKLKRYNSTTYNNTKKAKKTCLERYGVDNPGKSDKVKQKMKCTCLKKYGTEYSFQAQSTKDKIIQTSLYRYNTTNPGCSLTALQKIKNTFNNKYGNNVNCPGDLLKIEQYRIKQETTCLEKYGTKHVSQSEHAKRASRDSCMKKYGCSNHVTYEAYQMMKNNEYDVPVFTLQEFDLSGSKHTLRFKCNKCGNIFESFHSDGHHNHCPRCFPVNKYSGKSIAELEILDFIQKVSKFEVISGDRSVLKPYEIDIYIPELRIGFEYDGLYYHMHGSKPDDYHVKKTNACEQKGIQLVHIFENEWLYKQDIVKSRIKNMLGIYDKSVFARKCEIRQIHNVLETKQFLNDNHIQGYVSSSINIGLYYDNELISLMTFGKTRFSKKYQYELLRFCNKLGYHIPGAAGKMLKYFERTFNPLSLVSYADRRWSIGNVYEKIGFDLMHISSPNYWYFKTTYLESRLKFQKHKLPYILENFDITKSEKDNMLENGYKFIYDSGNRVYAKIYQRN